MLVIELVYVFLLLIMATMLLIGILLAVGFCRVLGILKKINNILSTWKR